MWSARSRSSLQGSSDCRDQPDRDRGCAATNAASSASSRLNRCRTSRTFVPILQPFKLAGPRSPRGRHTGAGRPGDDWRRAGFA